MLDTYIIEEIKRRERDEQRRREDAHRPRLEIPIAPPDADSNPVVRDDETPQRGVIIIDYSL